MPQLASSTGVSEALLDLIATEFAEATEMANVLLFTRSPIFRHFLSDLGGFILPHLRHPSGTDEFP